MYSTYDVYTLYIYIHLYTYLFFHINIINHIYDTWGLRSQGETNFCKWISGSDRFAARWTAVQQPDLEKKYYQFGARLKHLETSPTRAGVWKNMKVVNLLWICKSQTSTSAPWSSRRLAISCRWVDWLCKRFDNQWVHRTSKIFKDHSIAR